MPIQIKQKSEYLDEDWWKWSVELAGTQAELDQVMYVVYTLHPTFPDPVRRIWERDSNFRLDAEGWGEFTIYAEVALKDGAHQQLEHELELRYPDGSRTTK